MRDIGEEGDRVAKWWKAVSRIVRQYIVPYIEELEGKVDYNYLKMIEEEIDLHKGCSLLERLQYNLLFEFSRDILKVVDILLRAADPEYRSLRDDDMFGEILLVECESMQNIYKYDERFRNLDILYREGTTGYLIVHEGYLFATQNIEEVLRLHKPIIVVGYRSRISPQFEHLLASHGYEYIRRTVDEYDIVILFAKSSSIDLRETSNLFEM